MTDNDYIAEYVKERCPELLDTIDFNAWRFRMALSELAEKLCDHLSKRGTMIKDRNCQSCDNYKNEYCSVMDMKPHYPEKGCDYFSGKLAIEALKQESRWIPVSERLPDDYETVIASVNSECVFPDARYSTKYGWEFYGECYWRDLKGVDAWMPLPKAYKPESEN